MAADIRKVRLRYSRLDDDSTKQEIQARPTFQLLVIGPLLNVHPANAGACLAYLARVIDVRCCCYVPARSGNTDVDWNALIVPLILRRNHCCYIAGHKIDRIYSTLSVDGNVALQLKKSCRGIVATVG